MPVLYFGFWIILNGRLTLEVAATGILITVLVSLLNYRFIGISSVTEKKAWKKIFSIIAHLFNLVMAIAKGNIAMVKLVLSPEINVKSQLIYFKSPLRSEMAQVTLGNSITLPPGTFTAILENGVFGIHAIDAWMGVDVHNNIFVKQIQKIEGGH